MFSKFKCILHNFGCTLSASLVFFTILHRVSLSLKKVWSGMVSKMSIQLVYYPHTICWWTGCSGWMIYLDIVLAQKGLGFIGYFGKSTLDILDTWGQLQIKLEKQRLVVCSRKILTRRSVQHRIDRYFFCAWRSSPEALVVRPDGVHCFSVYASWVVSGNHGSALWRFVLICVVPQKFINPAN